MGDEKEKSKSFVVDKNNMDSTTEKNKHISDLEQAYTVAQEWMNNAVIQNQNLVQQVDVLTNENNTFKQQQQQQQQTLSSKQQQEQQQQSDIIQENVIKNEVVKTTEDHHQLLEKYTLLQNENEILKTNIKQMEEDEKEKSK